MRFIRKPIVIVGGVLLLLLFIGAVSGSSDKKPTPVVSSPSPLASTEIKTEPSVVNSEPSPPLSPTSLPSPEPSFNTSSIVSEKNITQPASSPSLKPNMNTNSAQCKYSCSSPDRDCSDFSSHAEAQNFFDCCGFSANNDPMRLDRATGAGNGKACENL